MTNDELVAILESKNSEIHFLRSLLSNMSAPFEEPPHGHIEVREPEEMESVKLEDLLDNFHMRDEFVNWLLRNVTKGQPKKGLKQPPNTDKV